MNKRRAPTLRARSALEQVELSRQSPLAHHTAICASVRAGILLRGDKRFDKIVAAAKAASK